MGTLPGKALQNRLQKYRNFYQSFRGLAWELCQERPSKIDCRSTETSTKVSGGLHGNFSRKGPPK